uniref:Vacuolar protein sorting-associated protein 13D n=1 Tax=Lygus hesperus TaxID=30085 RepID=A0A0A9XCZ7_LYGHE
MHNMVIDVEAAYTVQAAVERKTESTLDFAATAAAGMVVVVVAGAMQKKMVWLQLVLTVVASRTASEIADVNCSKTVPHKTLVVMDLAMQFGLSTCLVFSEAGVTEAVTVVGTSMHIPLLA